MNWQQWLEKGRRFRDNAQVRVGAWLEDPEREDTVFLVLTLVIGAVVGGAIVAFILATDGIGARMFPETGSGWRRFLVPTVTALVAGLLLYHYFPDARGSGIPQTKTALFMRRGQISLRTVLGKFFCTSATIACGIPLGREGPSVQIGAGIASVLGRSLRLSTSKVRQLVPVGATAAVAAAFNTPVAAVLFTLEELLGNLHARVLGNVVLGAATSWLVLRLFLGNEPLFAVPAYDLKHPVELVIYALLGIAGGLVSVGFVRLLLHLRARFSQVREIWKPYLPAVGGLLVGVLAFWVPEVMGTGYRFVGDALHGNMLWRLMAPLLVLKVLTVSVAYASGNAGGIFGPSLFIGAMVGGTLGGIAHWILPQYTAAPGAYALVGMGALFAGVVRAPFTSVIMIFELTHDYKIIVPLMISNAASLFISRRLQKETIYESLARQDGIVLPPREVERGQRTVRDVMREPHKSESDTLTLLAGSDEQLRLDPDDSLEQALETLGNAGTSIAAVFDDVAGARMKVVTLPDILAAYGIGDDRREAQSPATSRSVSLPALLAADVSAVIRVRGDDGSRADLGAQPDATRAADRTGELEPAQILEVRDVTKNLREAPLSTSPQGTVDPAQADEDQADRDPGRPPPLPPDLTS